MLSIISKGVNKVVFLIFVKFIRVLMNNFIRVIDSFIFCFFIFKIKYIDLIIEYCSLYVNKILNIFSGVEKVFLVFIILGNG